MKTLIRSIDQLNQKVGLAVRWVAIGMLVVTTYEVVARYLFNAPTVWAHQTVMILGGALVPLAWGWVHLHGGHVSMDAIHRRLSRRAQAIVNAVCNVLFLFPLVGLLTYISGARALRSWLAGETWIVSIWQPPMGPSRTVLMLGFVLLFLQGLAHFVREVHYIARGEEL